MTPEEIRMRAIEAAAKSPQPHADGYAAGVLDTAKLWSDWVFSGKLPVDEPVVGDLL